jgi:O-methyltransferase involved in polyketide biosynthesis
MQENDVLKLHGIEHTMLLPLWGRYTESKKRNGLIKDDKCIEIVTKLGLDFTDIAAQQHPVSRLSWIARAWNLDFELNRLSAAEKEITVVCLGCGLDTAFFRSTHSHRHWYDIDLLQVIELRKKLLGNVMHCTMISGSVLDPMSFQNIKIAGTLVVLALGLLYYFTEAEVKQIFKNIASLTNHAKIIIDYCSEKGVAMANKMILQNCHGTKMFWFANNETQLRSLHPHIKVIESYPVFQKISPLLSEQEAAVAALSDQQNINSFAIIEISPNKSSQKRSL